MSVSVACVKHQDAQHELINKIKQSVLFTDKEIDEYVKQLQLLKIDDLKNRKLCKENY